MEKRLLKVSAGAIIIGLAFFMPEVQMNSQESVPAYKNSRLPIEQRVADLLSRMTIEEKIAQLTTLWANRPQPNLQTDFSTDRGEFSPEKAAEVMKHGIGQIARQRERKGPREGATFANAVQKWLIENTRLGIPAILHDEILHGHMAQGSTSFPQPIALSTTWDPEFITKIFTAGALETRARGSHQVLGPNLDIAREPRWGRTEETYGEDPYLISRFAEAIVKALQGPGPAIHGDHVVATAKHYAAHGQPEGGTNIAPANFSERILREYHLPSFKAAVDAGIMSVMPSYNEIDGVPSHVNKWLLEKVLREEWGFDGHVVSDYYAIGQLVDLHHVAENKEAAAKHALEAGVDIELPDPDCFLRLVQLVKEGKVSEAVVDKAVMRHLRAKFLLGLFENPYVDVDRAVRVTNSSEHRDLAAEAARRSITLLKNENNLLPLDRNSLKSIAVIGPNAERVHLGGYSDNPGRGISVLQGIEDKVGSRIKVVYAEGCKITKEGGDWFADTAHLSDPEEDRKLIAQAVEVARSADVALLVLGGNEDTNKEAWADNHLGDRDSLELVGQQNDLVRAILETGKPTIVLLINSGPLSINYIAENVPAILEGFYLGQETGVGVADVLFGDYNPAGKLTVSFPRSVGQLPIYYNQKPTARRGYLFANKEPLFPFGFGLSYTTFDYSNLKVSPAQIRPAGQAKVSVTVTNSGKRAGDEIIQLYIRDLVSSVTRPVMELKDFNRISLAPGESKTVEFVITPDKLSFYDLNMENVVEPGWFDIMVGTSSVKYQTAKLEVTAEKPTALKEIFKPHFLVGAALNRRQIFAEDARGAEIVAAQFNTISPENILKWALVHPEPDKYDFAAADRYVAFGEKHKMFIVGHTLVWHNQTPRWVFERERGRPVDREGLLQRLREHVFTVVGRYKGRIHGWDVVNEALNQDGTMRQSSWLQIIGEDYLVKAFEFAHEADPNAELYYNDYDLALPAKRKGAVDLIRKLKASGVKIAGIGLQDHNLLDWPSVEDVDATIAAFSSLGIKVHITELDVDVLPRTTKPGADYAINIAPTPQLNPYPDRLPDSVQEALAKRYVDLFRIYLKHRASIDRVTFWGVADGDSWLNDWPIKGRTNYPLLFDRAGQEKPAFATLVRVLYSAKYLTK